MSEQAWARLEKEASTVYRGEGRFPLRAYSEFMPPPYVGIKPYEVHRDEHASTAHSARGDALDITEAEQAQELEAGIQRIGAHVVHELGKLLAGSSHALSKTLLTNNLAWPAELEAACERGALKHDPIVVFTSVALSRTQDDLGNVRWTLFGSSHDGAAAPFWGSFASRADSALDDFETILAWAGLDHRARILDGEKGLPRALAPLVLEEKDSLDGVRVIITFRPFAELPERIRRAYIAGDIVIAPTPASLAFFHHPRYAALDASLPLARQIPLLHLFPRVEQSCTIRIPQSGWLDERESGEDASGERDDEGHRVSTHVRRTHRWERVERDRRDSKQKTEPKHSDKVSIALFSTDPDDLELYGKPMARNAQIWTREYGLVLDGLRADREKILRAAEVTREGGRFGYRFVFPPMRAGGRELFWHLPIVARRRGEDVEKKAKDDELAEVDVLMRGPLGYVKAEHATEEAIVLEPRLLARPGYEEAARLFDHEPGLVRYTTSQNARKLLEMRELLERELSPSFVRVLLRIGRNQTIEQWLAHLAEVASDRMGGARLATMLRRVIAKGEEDIGAAITLDREDPRAFEETIWKSITSLCEGEYRMKENAEPITVNKGKTGGEAAKKAHIHVEDKRDLEALGDHLHTRHRALIKKHGMTGVAEVVDHVFKWETDFEYPWMEGWAKNQTAPAERNVVCVIPGKNRKEAVIMGDHYDTAYMEDVYEKERGGDGLRASAAGADDNHSATTALLMAADALLPLSKAGKLERDVWLVHLTGEEFPADSLGARAIAQQLVEGRLAFTAEDGEKRDVSDVRVVGVYVLDMIGHNADGDRDIFQIAPGEGAASARLALRAHHACRRWNAQAKKWNEADDRNDAGRAKRMPDGSKLPPTFSHLPLTGEVRVEWEPKSALYNTDGQAFSDIGVPVVLFMENYDINRTGYHDTHDTMANIDLDYCAAMTAITIEAVADLACAKET
jgi:hypothetical protein